MRATGTSRSPTTDEPENLVVLPRQATASGQQPKADCWPEDEDVEDFIAAATEGRYEEENEPDS